jgi:hypothetical protein
MIYLFNFGIVKFINLKLLNLICNYFYFFTFNKLFKQSIKIVVYYKLKL